MSKRSSRRLALVAGAALAVGSMAPAVATTINAGADGQVDVEVNGVPEVPSLPEIPAPPVEAVEQFAAALQNSVDVDQLGLTAEGSVEALIEALTAFATSAPTNAVGVEAGAGLLGDDDASLNLQANVDEGAIADFLDGAPGAAEALAAAGVEAVLPLLAEAEGTVGGAVEAASDLQAALEAYLGQIALPTLPEDPTSVLSGVSADINVIASIMASM